MTCQQVRSVGELVAGVRSAQNHSGVSYGRLGLGGTISRLPKSSRLRKSARGRPHGLPKYKRPGSRPQRAGPLIRNLLPTSPPSRGVAHASHAAGCAGGTPASPAVPPPRSQALPGSALPGGSASFRGNLCRGNRFMAARGGRASAQCVTRRSLVTRENGRAAQTGLAPLGGSCVCSAVSPPYLQEVMALERSVSCVATVSSRSFVDCF